MILKDKPRYKQIYQLDLAEEMTGYNRQVIMKRARRQGWTLAKTVKQYIEEAGGTRPV